MNRSEVGNFGAVGADRKAGKALAAVAVLLCLSLTGCNRVARTIASKMPARSGTTGTPPDPGASGAGSILSRPLGGDEVAALLYGKGAGPKATPKWRPAKLWQGKEGPGLDPGAEWVCGAHQILPFEQEGAVRALVVTGARPSDWDCMACETAVGIAILTEVADGWRLDGADLEVGTYGRSGVPPEAVAVQVGPQKVGVVFEPTFSSAGTTTKGFLLVAERRGGGFAEILDIAETEANNMGDCDDGEGEDAVPCWEFATSWGFARSEGKDLWDLQTTTSGRRLAQDGSTVEPFSETKLYRFDGTKYAPVQ